MFKTLLSNAWTALSSKARLYIEYVLIAAIIIACSWGVTQYVQNRGMQKTIAQLNTTNGTQDATIKQLVQDNLDTKAAIATMQMTRTLDHNTIQGLVDGLTDIYTRSAKSNQRLNNLEKHDAKAKSYLHEQPVPASVRCLLDHTPCPIAPAHEDGNPASRPAEQPAGAVRTPEARQGGNRSASVVLELRRDTQCRRMGDRCSRLRSAYAMSCWMDRCGQAGQAAVAAVWASETSRTG